MSCELGSFEDAILHSIGNNHKNDNFKFRVRARNNAERLEILKDINETKEKFEEEISKIIGKCIVLIDFDNLMINVKRK